MCLTVKEMQRILIVYLITSVVIIVVAITVVAISYTSGILGPKKTLVTTSSSDSGRSDSGSESGKTNSGKTESGKTDSGKTYSGKTDSGKTGGHNTDTSTLSQEIKDAVILTNKMRAQQSLNSVTHDDELAKHATAWAEWMSSNEQFCHPVDRDCKIEWPELKKYIGGTGKPEYGPTPPGADGQNIAYKAGSGEVITLTFSEAVEEWYNECQCCARQNSPSNSCKTLTRSPENGHYTQLMWPSTLKVGFGKATGKMNGLDAVWVVCNYSPAGNLVTGPSSTEFAASANFKGFVSGQQCPWGSKKNVFKSDECCNSPCLGSIYFAGCETKCGTS